MNSTTKSRLNAIEKTLAAKPMIPKSVCKLKNGAITQISGMSVIQHFLNGEIIEVCCDDPDLACLLRAFDIEKTIKIELISIESGDRIKRVEV